MKLHYSLFTAGLLSLFFLACLNTEAPETDSKDPKTDTTDTGGIDSPRPGSLYQVCDSGQIIWVIRLNADTADAEDHLFPIGTTLDSVYAGAPFAQDLASILIDSIDSGYVYGSFEIQDTAATAVITGRFVVEKVMEVPTCGKIPGLACSDSLSPIRLEGEWIWVSPSSSAKKHLHAVTWTGERLVAVGDSGTILTSQDGAEWAGQASGTSLPLRDVSCSHGGVVAVGDSGVILRSDDGVTWSTTTSGMPHSLRTVGWTGERYVAAGDSGALLTSLDGVVWNTESSGVIATLRAVAASSDRTVVVGNEGAVLLSINEGVWEQRTVEASNPGLYAAVWTGTHFLAYGGSSPPPTLYMLKSPGGDTWDNTMSLPHFLRTKLVGNQPAGISADPPLMPTKYVVRFSADSGTTWTSRDVPNVPEFISVRDFAWTGEQLVVVGDHGGILTLP